MKVFRIRFRLMKLFVSLSIVLTAVTSISAQSDLKSRIDRLAEPYVESKTVFGMTVGVLQGGETTIVGYGHSAEDSRRKPDGKTIYEIGSISKVFTGILLGDAVTQGRVKLDQAVQDLLPAKATLPTHEKRAITLQDLSTHVSGLPRMPTNFAPADVINPFADYTTQQLYAFLSDYELPRAPGETQEYSNVAVGLLGHVLALDAGKTYEQLLRDRLTDPIELNDTVITLSSEQQSRLAVPHFADGTMTSTWDFPALAGAGAIRSTVADMLKFAGASLAPPDSEIGQAIEAAWKIHQRPLATNDFAMGLGWHIARDGQTRWHNGQTGGYHSMLLVNRNLNAAVIVLANTATTEVDRLGEHIIQMVAGQDIKPRTFAAFTDVEVSDDAMQRYVGKYQLVPGVEFTVSVDDGKLMVGLTGQPTFQVFAQSDIEWKYKVVEATLTFAVDEDGKCNAVELFQGGVRRTAKRIQ